ncbi:hypothetical protein [Geomonas sp.]|uniref:hypothetical protein n=1 Tax=Geomonas sp. TaxID=2651584 RepID=UPI002B489BA8|nr:hypothetical protein [Geomonas sp.]HJV34905.1 hypothetical protein [Geomonas sp.]
MQGYELIKKIEMEKSKHPERVFIKWWRKEEDWLDFDLASRFVETLDYSAKIDGFDLLDINQMWRILEQRCNGRVTKVQKDDGSYVLMYTPPKGAEMEERMPEYPYSPETLLMILDAETDNNFVD